MGAPGDAGRANLVIGLLSCDIKLMQQAVDMLVKAFGEPDLQSAVLDFTHSDYYAKEMGEKLYRRFISFKRTVSLKGIYKVKIRTNSIEKKFMISGNRKVNIDPGYVDLAKLVLFSTKDYIHRVYLDKGIFAEITLFYRGRTFNPWPWTYPDYKTAEYIAIFNSIRELYQNKRMTCS